MYSGIFPALLTPLTADDQINTIVLRELIDLLLSHKVHGFYVCGSTGEGVLLTEKERQLVAATAVEHVKGQVPVFVHVGAPATPMAERLAQHAQEIGADAVASVPPFYFTVGQKGIEEHYRRIARSTDLPVYIYNLPYATGVDVDAGVVGPLVEEGAVQGLKYTSNDQLNFRKILEVCGDRLNVFSGPDQMLLPFLVMGAHGGIGTTYNMMPGLYMQLYGAWQAGDMAKAQELQYLADRVIMVLRGYGTVSSAKATMRILGVDCGQARAPLLHISAEEQERLRQELQDVGFFAVAAGTTL